MQRLCEVFCIYLKMYMMLRQESFTNVDLAELQVNIINIFKYQSVELIR